MVNLKINLMEMSRILTIKLWPVVFSLMGIMSVANKAIAGGGWPQPKGKAYFKLSEWWVVADKHFTLDGFKDPNVTTALYNTTFYGEYGFTNQITGIITYLY